MVFQSDISDILNNWHNLLLETYSSEKLKCLRGNIEDDYHLNGRNILVWHSDAFNKIQDKELNSYKNIENLLYYSDSIMYSTANLFLLKPLLYSPEVYKTEAGGKVIYPYNEGLADRRYFTFAEVLFEKLYAYWSQLAHILKGYYFPESKKRGVYFTSIIRSIDKLKIESENFNWLKNFSNNEYKKLNEERIDIVHNLSLGTAFRYNNITNATNYEAISKNLEYRDNLPSFFKEHINYTLTGFEKTLNLVLE